MFREKWLSPFSRKTYYLSLKSRHGVNYGLVVEVFKYPDISLNRKKKREGGERNHQMKQETNKNQNKTKKQNLLKPIHPSDRVLLENLACQKGKPSHVPHWLQLLKLEVTFWRPGSAQTESTQGLKYFKLNTLHLCPMPINFYRHHKESLADESSSCI